MILLLTHASAGEVVSLAWSPAGEEVLAQVYEEARQEVVTVLVRPQGGPVVVVPIPGTDLGADWITGGVLVLSGSTGTHQVDFSTQAALPMLEGGWPQVRMNPARDTLATWSAERGTRFWVPEPCKPKVKETTCLPARWIPKKGAPTPPHPIAWLPDGGFLVSAGGDAGWSLDHHDPNGVRVGGVPLPGGPARVDVARDGTFVAWLDGRSSPWVVRGAVGGALAPLPDLGTVAAVDLSEDGRVLVVGSLSGSVRAWWTDGSGSATWTPGHVRVRAVAVSDDGARVAADADGVVTFWSPRPE